jgi:hypothetical protein
MSYLKYVSLSFSALLLLNSFSLAIFCYLSRNLLFSDFCFCHFAEAGKTSSCHVEKIDPDDVDTYEDMLDVNGFIDHKVMYGPLAIWRRISRILKNKKHKKVGFTRNRSFDPTNIIDVT